VPAFLIVEIEVRDPAGYEEYKQLAARTIQAAGGRYLARGGATEVLEGEWNPKRLVILEFPSVARAKEWWSSADYGRARGIRERCARTRMILTEGLP
jgi:uncharacterized protein (DUF1330 family)